MVLAMASLGLPGLGNFVAEFLVLVGVYQVSPALAWVNSYTAVRAGRGWKYLGDRAYPFGLDDPDRVDELADFAQRLRAGCERVEKDIKAGKYRTRADALEVLTMLAAPVPKR